MALLVIDLRGGLGFLIGIGVPGVALIINEVNPLCITAGVLLEGCYVFVGGSCVSMDIYL
jgi:hypothetical protein